MYLVLCLSLASFAIARNNGVGKLPTMGYDVRTSANKFMVGKDVDAVV